jgi:virulence-associated protein VagC
MTWASRQFPNTVAHSFHNTAKLTPRRADKLNRKPITAELGFSCNVSLLLSGSLRLTIGPPSGPLVLKFVRYAVQPVQFRNALANAEIAGAIRVKGVDADGDIVGARIRANLRKLIRDSQCGLTGGRRIAIIWYVSFRSRGNMTRSIKKRRSQPEKAGPRHAVAEAKVFMTGRSQAVRLPEEYRVTDSSVYVKRLGNSIVLIPKTADHWAGLVRCPRRIPSRFCA